MGDASGIEVGDVLGDFRIVGMLGEGGMGVVYLARDQRLERNVALKVVAPHLAHSEEFRRRFIAEARNAAAIDHPNVVTVYSSGTIDDSLYIAMQYIDGTDLRATLAGGRLSPKVAVEVISEVSAALDAAHAAGMVHRDVKPGNVLIEGNPGEGRVFLTDFGLTKGSGDSGTQLTGAGRWVGTIDYVAPEQIQGGTIDARTDVYALGCVLYEALTGRVAFSGDEMQKMWCHGHEPFPQLTADDVPNFGELNTVLERATAKDPDRRFPSAGALARAASRAAVGTGTVSGRAPVRFRDSPTTAMPSPSAARPAVSNARSGSSRTVAIVGAIAIVCAGVIAAAILFAGGDSAGEANGTTVIREPTSPPGTTAIREQASPPRTTNKTTAIREKTAGSGTAGDWPGGSAYSAMLGAFLSEGGARRWQRRALARGLEAGVLYSSDHSSLRPGYWVVFSGSFSNLPEADARATEARALEFPGSYAKYVSP